MAIDTSMYQTVGRDPDFLGMAGKAMQLRELKEASAARDLQRQQQAAEMQTQGKIRDLMQQPGMVGPGGQLTPQGQQALSQLSLSTGLKVREQEANIDKTMSEAAAKRAESKKNLAEVGAKLGGEGRAQIIHNLGLMNQFAKAAKATDPELWGTEGLPQLIAAYTPTDADSPATAQFKAKVVEGLQKELEAWPTADPQWKMSRLQEHALASLNHAQGIAEGAQLETSRHNRATEKNAAGDLGVRQGQLGLNRQEFEARKAGGKFDASGEKSPRMAALEYKKEQNYHNDTASLEAVKANILERVAAAKELLNHPGLPRITGKTGAFPDLPGGDAANARAVLDKVVGGLSLGALADMKAAGKTGASGLGSVTEPEHKLLQDSEAAVKTSQSESAMKEHLRQYITRHENSLKRIEKAYGNKYAEYIGKSEQATKPARDPAREKRLRDAGATQEEIDALFGGS